MDTDKYIKLIEQVLECKRISPEEKKKYLYLLTALQNINDYKITEYEQNSYKFGDKSLNDKEKIIYELNMLSKIDSKEIIKKIKKYAYRLDKGKTKENINRLKKDITKLQMQYNIKPRFYTVFESIVDEETKETPAEIILREIEEMKKKR